MKFRAGIPLTIAALVLAGGCSRHKAPPAEAAVTEEKPLSYELRLGKASYQHYCATCHGETGGGDGFNAFNVDPQPRNHSDPAFQKARTDAELADAIRRGGAGVGLSPLMPPWGKTLTEDQISEVVAYIRTLKQPEEKPAQSGS